MSKSANAALLGLILAAPAIAQDAEPRIGLGRPALPEEIAAWDVKVMPDGRGLPVGSGDVATGEQKFLEHCAVCHGDFAEGLGNWPALSGGEDTLARKDPIKTVGSYWPHLSTVWDYVHRSMPFGQAQTLTADDTYAITAYILYSNFLVEDDFVLSNENFLDVQMPNADGFIVDDRAETEYPVFAVDPCMRDCKPEVQITMHASVLDVTPDHGTEDAAAPAEQPAPDQMAQPGDAPAGDTPTEQEATGTAAPEPVAPDPELVAAGEAVFKKCKACHMVGEDAKNRVGPILNGVVDRHIASVDGFKYSSALIEAGASGMVWDDQSLHEFLTKPSAFMSGTKMSFAGLKKPEDIDAVIAYLRAHP